MKTDSKTYRRYLKRHGRENQFFITSYIGIGLIKSKDDKPEELSTTWGPKDIENSKSESKLFIQKASLTYCVSTFESYIDDFFLKELKQLIPEKLPFFDEIDDRGTKKSIYKKLELLVANFPELKSKEYFLVKSAIFWRNDLIHGTSEKFDQEIKTNLRRYAQDIEKSYKALNIDEFIKHYDNNKIPTFKETLSMMTSLRNFAAQIDRYFMEDISVEKYVVYRLKEIFDIYGNVVDPTPKKQNIYWDNVITTHLGLREQEFKEFKNTKLGDKLYKVTSNEELQSLICDY